MESISLPAARRPGPLASKRLLALARDERLVDQVRQGNEAAFEVAFERHGPGILSFCRHLLGDPQEAEDAVQHTFAAAYRDLLRDSREIKLKPWLFTIARNRCYSMLRARREQPAEEREVATADLDEQVERRAELRQLVQDLGELPVEQRAALVLSEIGALSHTEVAEVLGCEVQNVKALVFRARSGLIQRREGRDLDCDDVREQLANLRGGSLRRSELRHHLRACEGCSEFRQQVKAQRRMLAVALPVVPSLKLKSSVLAAAGLGGGSGGAGGAAAGGLGTALTAAGGGATVAKVAILGVLAGGGAIAGGAALDDPAPDRPPAAVEDPAAASSEAGGGLGAAGAAVQGREAAAERARATAQKRKAKSKGRANGQGPAAVPGGRGLGAEKRSQQANGVPNGRGPVDAPPAQTPVHRGPPAEPQGNSAPGPTAIQPKVQPAPQLQQKVVGKRTP